MIHTYTSNMFHDWTYSGYDSAEFSLDVDELNKKEEVIEIKDAEGYDDYITETSILDTAHAIIADAIEVELLDPDYNDRDPEYARVLGIYADEYDTEITMVDAIDTESDFDADEINSRIFESPYNW